MSRTSPILVALLLMSGCGYVSVETVSVDAGDTDALDARVDDFPAFARWRIREAESGQEITRLFDDTPRPVHLNMFYVMASPTFAADGENTRLNFAVASGSPNPDTGGAIAVASGTKLDELDGARALTVETKHQFLRCVDDDGRIFQLGDGDIAESGWLSVREDAGREILAIRFASSDGWSRFGAIDPARWCLSDAPHVFHWIVDTDAADESDRIRLSIDGASVAVERINGDGPAQGAALALGAGTRRVAIGRSPNEPRTFDGSVDFVAIYDRILSPAEITMRAAALALRSD